MEKMIRHSINSFWTQSLVSEAQTKSTLVNCDLSFMAMGVTHSVWEYAAKNLHDVRRSIDDHQSENDDRGYMLQSTRARFD